VKPSSFFAWLLKSGAASLCLSYLRLWREGVLSDSFQLSASIAKSSNGVAAAEAVARQAIPEFVAWAKARKAD
jgi:hypothetical protein